MISKFKLGLGPMSHEIVDILTRYSINDNPIMIIASRNQVDADSGYVMTTAELKTAIDRNPSDNIMLCRDHCGPYFLDSEKNLSQEAAIEASKKTIAADIEMGFDLIHIDTSRCENGYVVADHLIKFCLDLNPNIQFEFGTEENVGVAAGINKYKDDVVFASQFPNMQFVVAQTGSLVYENRQAGSFASNIVKDLVEFANEAGVGLKEHNADYLTATEIERRKLVGVHALNVAPQLGVIQTKLIKDWAKIYGLTKEWDAFANAVISSGKWSKWTDSEDSEMRVAVAGHYLFNDISYKTLVDELSIHTNWQQKLEYRVQDLIDLYLRNL
jgi:hypothetical protein